MAYKQSNNPISRKRSPIKNISWTEENMDPYGESDPFDTSDGQKNPGTFISSHPEYDADYVASQDKSRHYPDGVDRKTSSPLNVSDARGNSNAGKYDDEGLSSSEFCGPAGGSKPGTYPVNTLGRVKAAIGYSGNAPNPAGIKACANRARKRLES